jgi:hypothetical protein
MFSTTEKVYTRNKGLEQGVNFQYYQLVCSSQQDSNRHEPTDMSLALINATNMTGQLFFDKPKRQWRGPHFKTLNP